MEATESSQPSKLSEKEIGEAGSILFESFKNGDAFTGYILEGINESDSERIIQDYYRRIVIFFDNIDGLSATKDRSGKVNSVGTFIPHNITKNSIATGEKMAKLNISGLMTLMFNQGIKDAYAKLRALKRFHHLILLTDHMRATDMGVEPHIYAQYLGAVGNNGSGIRLLLNGIKKLKEKRVPIYFWTVSNENSEMYSKLGFTSLGEKTDAISGLSFWRFIYNPSESDVQSTQSHTTNSIERALRRI